MYIYPGEKNSQQLDMSQYLSYIFVCISLRERVTFDVIIMMFVLYNYKTNMLNWIFIVLAHRNNSPQIDMLLHSNTLS